MSEPDNTKPRLLPKVVDAVLTAIVLCMLALGLCSMYTAANSPEALRGGIMLNERPPVP